MADDADLIAAAKAELRARLRFRRNQYSAALPDFVRAVAFRAPPTPLRPLLEDAQCVGGYAPGGSEAPVDGLLAAAAAGGAITALPWFGMRDAAMEFRRWSDGDALEPGPWGVAQPVGLGQTIVPDLILAPLLGFDRSGRRIGQGAGHYDRYFAAHTGSIRIGIGWSVQEVDAVPIGPHDLPLDAILTEQEFIVTGHRL